MGAPNHQPQCLDGTKLGVLNRRQRTNLFGSSYTKKVKRDVARKDDLVPWGVILHLSAALPFTKSEVEVVLSFQRAFPKLTLQLPESSDPQYRALQKDARK